MLEAGESRSHYLFRLVRRSLGIEGYRFGMQAYDNEVVGHAQKTITLAVGAIAHSVICGIDSFLIPSLSEVIFHNKRTDQELDWSLSYDLITNFTAIIAAGLAGAHTRNAGIGIATYLGGRTIFNAMTHIRSDLLQQINPDNGLV